MHCELVFVTFSGFNIFSDADCSDIDTHRNTESAYYIIDSTHGTMPTFSATVQRIL